VIGRGRLARRIALAAGLIPLLFAGIPVRALAAQAEGAPDARSPLPVPSRYPVYHRGLDASLVSVGAVSLAASFLVGGDHSPVPDAGFDHGNIPWALDRNEVGHHNPDADRLSNWTRNTAFAFPVALAFITAPEGERFDTVRRRAGLYAETLLLGQGVVRLGKNGIGRARPFTYLPASERPDEMPYDVTKDRAFRSMPSGHAVTGWLAVGLGLTEHLLTRPDAGGWERRTAGFLGGALATSTSVLRVKAGQHFPTDAIVGGSVGLALGVSMPLLHRDGRPLPSRGAWLDAAGSVVAGVLVGAVLASKL
jgi:membrane-associated phospholipid phosphatase